MGFAFERRARSRKASGGLRALLGRAPAADEVRGRLARLLPRMWKGEVEVGAKRISAELHDFVAPLRLGVDDDGALWVRGDATVGPAVCDDAVARLGPVLEELDYVWVEPAPDPRAAALAWLADELRGGATRIGLEPGLSFHVDAPVLTALGPRDAAWRDAVLADPAAGRDAFAWWTRRPGAAAHARALLAMWTEVPWREPFDDDEHALMQQVDADLTAAAAAGGDLVIPYAEWAELVGYLGDAARAATLAAKAGGPSTIGYRRYDMDLEVDAWTLTLPAAFVGRIEDERYWATDGSRAIELHTLETTETDSARLLEVAPELHAVIERLAEPGPGGRFGRVEAHDEGEVHVVHGLIAVAPHVAILTCKGKPSDHAWALATWRSLRLS